MRKLIPPALIAAAIIAYFASGFDSVVSFEGLRTHRAELAAFTAGHPLGAAGAFTAAYVAAVALSLPAAAVFTLAAGLIFGVAEGTLIVVPASTLGATLLFLAARSAFAPMLERRLARAPRLAGVVVELRAHAASYLLFLRLVPVVPFWLVNLAAALADVRPRVFIATTFIGVIPASLVLTGVGAGLDAAFAAGAAPDLGVLLRGDVLTPLLGLAALSLLPMAARRLGRARRAA